MAKTILIRENLTYTDLVNNTNNANVKATLQELASLGLSGYIMSNALNHMNRPVSGCPMEDYRANPVKELYNYIKRGTQAVIEDLDSRLLFVKEVVANPTAEDKAICKDSVPFLVSYTFNSLYKRVNADVKAVMKPIADSKNQALKDKFINYLPSFIGCLDKNCWTLDRVERAIIHSQRGMYHCIGLDK